MQKGLQIESPEENPPRKYNTFKPPSSSDFQNAADKIRISAQFAAISARATEENRFKLA
jgi:hypothetical protein